MAQPVWVLSVDLQTKTATFQSGMADAAKAAKSSFSEIKSVAGEMSSATSGSMGEARHSVMLLSEELGLGLPRGVTAFLTSLGPIASVMSSAFPFVAIAAGATLLLEHLSKLRAEGQKLTESQVQFGTSTARVLNALNDKLIESGIRVDELNGQHLSALEKQLRLIDHESMNDLAKSFDDLAKAADGVFANLKSHWYEFGPGADAAKTSLQQVKDSYEALLAHGNSKGANDFLAAAVQNAKRVVELQRQARDSQADSNGGQRGDYNKFEEAKLELQKMGIGFTDKEIEGEQRKLWVLQDQIKAYQAVTDAAANDKKAKNIEASHRADDESDKTDRANAQALKAEQEEEDRLYEQHYKEVIEQIQSSEKLKIEETKEGTAARLAAIDAALKEENAKGMQAENSYKELLIARVNTMKEMQQEQEKLQAEAGKEDAEHTLKMGELQIAAQRETFQNLVAMAKMTSREKLQAEIQLADDELKMQREANQKEIAALNQHDQDYENKKQALNNKIEELEKAHQNKVQQLQDQAQAKQLSTLMSWNNRVNADYASGFSRVIMGKENFAHMMESMDSQIADSALKFALMSVMQLETVQGRKRLGDARTAAADAYASAGNPITGAVEAVGAFAAVMQFADGGLVPGTSNTDSVPAMLTPGESVLPKQLTERLETAARSDDGGNKPSPHFHAHYSPNLQALDSTGLEKMLTKHASTFEKHFRDHVRKMNR